MSLGTLALIGEMRPKNLVHVILDNEAYESTGGQPTITKGLNLGEVARACGYPSVSVIRDLKALGFALEEIHYGPVCLLVKTRLSPVQEFPRVTIGPPELCLRFRQALATDGHSESFV